MSEQDWEGIAGNRVNHRTVGPHRAWCKCGEWCYPDSRCTCCMETEGYEVRWSHPDNPLMTRAEWEATVDYERGIGWLHIDMCPQELTNSTDEYWAMLHRTVKGIIGAALNIEEDS